MNFPFRELIVSFGLLLSSIPARALEKGDFFEPGAPFLRSALVFKGHAKMNRSRRGVVIPLGHGLWTCFDPDLLRVAATWRAPEDEPPLSMDSMAAISYPDGKAKANKPPQLQGKILTASPELPGFSARPDKRSDPRKLTLVNDPKTKVGSMPAIYGRWLGLELRGKNPVLAYRAADTEFHEFLHAPDAETVRRSIKISPGKKIIYLHLDPAPGRLDGARAEIPNSPLPQLRLLAAPGVTLQSDPESGTFLKIEPGEKNRLIHIFRSAEKIPDVSGLPSFPEKKPARIFGNEVLKAKSPAPQKNSAPIASRQLKIPESNEQKRTIRPTDIAFLSDGTALNCTLDGDVWRIKNIAKPEASWSRCASGIFEPTGIEIDKNDRVFVFGRDQITELIDHDADGIFEQYRNASDAFIQSLHTRDYAMSFALAGDGSFYVTKGGIWNPGKSYANELSPHRGCVLHLSADGKQARVIADGLRLPYVGLDTAGRVFASDQQGHHVPSSPVDLIGDDKPSFGFSPTNFRKKPSTEPLFWFPYAINRSASGFALFSKKAFPDLPGQLAQLSWSGRLFPVLTPEKGQPFAWKLPHELPFPVLNAATHPKNGHLYAVGLGISGYKPQTTAFWGLAELWQSAPFATPATWEVSQNKQVITFNSPLRAGLDPAASHLDISAWNIKRTAKYGSGHYRWNGEAGEHHLLPTKTTLSTDRRRLSLETPDLFNSSVLRLSLNFIDPDGKNELTHELYTTVRHLPKASPAELAAMKTKKVKLKPGVAERGQKVFAAYGCAGCHSLEDQPLTGPPLNHVATRHAKNTDAFLHRAILSPAKDIAKGYDAGMPSFKGVIPEQDIAHLVAYLKTLK